MTEAMGAVVEFAASGWEIAVRCKRTHKEREFCYTTPRQSDSVAFVASAGSMETKKRQDREKKAGARIFIAGKERR